MSASPSPPAASHGDAKDIAPKKTKGAGLLTSLISSDEEKSEESEDQAPMRATPNSKDAKAGAVVVCVLLLEGSV